MKRQLSAVCIVVFSLVVSAGCASSITSDEVTPTPTESSPTPTPVPTPNIDTGDGSDGEVIVDADLVVNACQVLSTASAGGTTVNVASAAGLAVGDRLLLIQMQDDFVVASGDPVETTIAGAAGNWELVSIAGVAGTAITVAVPLVHTYSTSAGAAAQSCHVPQFSSVTVTTGRMLAAAWDGSTGGVVAFLVAGELANGGEINADAAGFRGGVLTGNDNNEDAFANDYADAMGGGKAEGLDIKSFAMGGRGAMANAGGGGNAHNAGGGGGGNGGAGGIGGKQANVRGDEPMTRGRAGGNVSIPGALTLGGGGGAGQQDNGTGAGGGRGGGIILIRAESVSGAGLITAAGEVGGASGDDGAGGGGAGGSIRIETHDSTATGPIRALGGAGGNSNGALHGPGGGGGGGRVQTYGIAITPEVAFGISGVDVGAGNDPWGAADGSPGIAETLILP